MDKAKDNSTLRKGISISLVITILFTCGFVLGALTKAIESMNAEPVPETTVTVVTTTQAPVTQAPETTTAVPTTAAPETTTAVPETETTTTVPSSEETTTTAPAEEETEEELGFIAGLIVSLLEFKKQIIDFIISICGSLPF